LQLLAPGQRDGERPVEGVAGPGRVHRRDFRHGQLTGLGAGPPADRCRPASDRTPPDPGGAQRFADVTGAGRAERGGAGHDVGHRQQVGEDGTPAPRVEQQGPAAVRGGPGQRRMVAVGQHHVGAGEHVGEPGRDGRLDPAGVPADDRPGAGRVQHRDGRDRRRRPGQRRRVEQRHPVRLRVGPDQPAQRMRADRGDQRDLGPQRGRGDRGVGGRPARRDVGGQGLGLGVHSGQPFHPLDQVHGGQADTDDVHAAQFASSEKNVPTLRKTSATPSPMPWAMSAAGPGFVPM
jgi:hypothetical protein